MKNERNEGLKDEELKGWRMKGMKDWRIEGWKEWRIEGRRMKGWEDGYEWMVHMLLYTVQYIELIV